MTWVRASHNSIYGRIETDWNFKSGEFQLNIRIPANTTGTVFLPADSTAVITESGTSLDKAEGVKLLRPEPDHVIMSIESGRYHFIAKASPSGHTHPTANMNSILPQNAHK